MRTRKRRDPRMRQRTPGREKMPGRGFEVVLLPKENKASGCEEGHTEAQRNPLCQHFQGAPDNVVPASDPNALTVTAVLWVSS